MCLSWENEDAMLHVDGEVLPVQIGGGGVPLTIPVELDYFSITGKYDTVSRYSINILETTSTKKLDDRWNLFAKH